MYDTTTCRREAAFCDIYYKNEKCFEDGVCLYASANYACGVKIKSLRALPRYKFEEFHANFFPCSEGCGVQLEKMISGIHAELVFFFVSSIFMHKMSPRYRWLTKCLMMGSYIRRTFCTCPGLLITFDRQHSFEGRI